MSVFGTPATAVGSRSGSTTGFTSNPFSTALGDLIVVAVQSFAEGGSPTVTDQIGNTYIPGTNESNADNQFTRMYYCLSSIGANASNSIIVNYSPNSTFGGGCWIWDVPLTGGTAVFDTQGVGNNTTGTAIATGNFNTAGSDEIVFAASSSATVSGSFAAGPGYTLDSSGWAFGNGGAEHIQFSSPQTGIHSSFTGPSSGDWVIVAMAFKSAPLPVTTSKVHSGDAAIQVTQDKVHSGDAFIIIPSFSHFGDAYIIAVEVSAVRLQGNIQFPIPPQGFVFFNGTILAPQLSFVNLNGTIQGGTLSFVSLNGTIRIQNLSYVQLQGTISDAKQASPQHNADFYVSTASISFVNLAASIVASVSPGPCSSFPDASFCKLSGWIVIPGDSQQMPNSGFSAADDFLSSQIALAAYKRMSIVNLAGFNLIITALTTGVLSWQTRARSWLTRVDEAPGGILLTTSTTVHTLPNGAVVTTTTEQRQQQDTAVTIVTINNSATPERTSVIVTEKTQSGQTITRESDTTNINGIRNTLTKRTVYTTPPETDNIQPITVRTLDGVSHYQFFDQINTEWAGGDQEGLTNTINQEQIMPGSINGETTDPFGNPILTRVTDNQLTDPSGKFTHTHTEETGITDVGTTTTDTAEQFNGIIDTTVTTTTYPDGSQEVKTTVKNLITGDTIETDNETVTDEYGQVTNTVTTDETHTFVDPITGILRTIETKTVIVNKGGVITTDTTVATTDNFEDDIVDDKIKVIFIQEFTITCVLDETTMYAIWEINENHQKQYALQELFGQMLGNANLSYALRQSVFAQFNAANCVPSVPLQTMGKVFQVVFAPSASAFRAKYIPGTEPHVYELQMILQERSDMINGTIGF